MTQEENAGIGQQVLKMAAEMGLSSQLEDAENIDIDIQGELLNILQGEADSVTLKGEGVVTPQDLRLEELELQTGNIAINLLSAALGKLELNQPTDASVRVVVTTADINRAMSSQFLGNLLQRLEIPVKNQVMTIELQQAECNLPGEGKLALKAEILTHLADKTQSAALKTQPAALRVVLNSKAGGQCISLNQAEFFDGKDLPLDLTAALFMKISELLNQRHFQYEGISIYLRQLEVEKDKITLWVKAHIEQIPT